jgi:hypothetical protein
VTCKSFGQRPGLKRALWQMVIVKHFGIFGEFYSNVQRVHSIFHILLKNGERRYWWENPTPAVVVGVAVLLSSFSFYGVFHVLQTVEK